MPHLLRRPFVPGAVVALALVACAGDDGLDPSPVDDTSDTIGSDEVSGPADAAADAERPDADATTLARVTVDGTPLPVAAVACDEGPEVTALFEDGGDLTVTGDADGGVVSVRVVLDVDGASQAWASDDPADLDVTLPPDGAEGEATLSAVDVDGDDDPARDDTEVGFTLPCDA